MRTSNSHRFLVVSNCVLLAIVAWGLLAGQPLFDRTANAQGRDNPASQRDNMVKELRTMNGRLADMARSQQDEVKAANKRFNDLTKLLKDGQVKVSVKEGIRRGR